MGNMYETIYECNGCEKRRLNLDDGCCENEASTHYILPKHITGLHFIENMVPSAFVNAVFVCTELIERKVITVEERALVFDELRIDLIRVYGPDFTAGFMLGFLPHNSVFEERYYWFAKASEAIEVFNAY